MNGCIDREIYKQLGWHRMRFFSPEEEKVIAAWMVAVMRASSQSTCVLPSASSTLRGFLHSKAFSQVIFFSFTQAFVNIVLVSQLCPMFSGTPQVRILFLFLMIYFQQTECGQNNGGQLLRIGQKCSESHFCVVNLLVPFPERSWKVDCPGSRFSSSLCRREHSQYHNHDCSLTKESEPEPPLPIPHS